MPKLQKTDKPMPELEGVDPTSRAAFRALTDVMRLNGYAMSRRFASKGAHIGQAACLRVLDADDGMSQRDMAEFLHVSRPSITAMLQAVEKAGLVVRKPDESDQRLTRVYLTEAGQKAATELRSVLADHIRDVFYGMSDHERNELIRLLGLVRENIEHALKQQKGTVAE